MLGEQMEVAIRLHVRQGPLYVQVEIIIGKAQCHWQWLAMVLIFLLVGPKSSGHRRGITTIFSHCDLHYDWNLINIRPLIGLGVFWQAGYVH